MVTLATESWQDEFRVQLADRYGPAKARWLFARYASAFPAGYRDVFSAGQAALDVGSLESFEPEVEPRLVLWPLLGSAAGARFALFWSTPRPALLADVFPVLENMGLRIADHRPFDVRPVGRSAVRVEEFEVLPHDSAPLADPATRDLMTDAFTAVWRGDAEDDGFNQLVLKAGLGWRDVALLRAIHAYLRQAAVAFSQAHVERTLLTHREVTGLLVELFRMRFDPAIADADGQVEVDARIEAALSEVVHLNEDRVLRAMRTVILATVRTNFFQRDPAGRAKSYLVLKLDPSRLAFLPDPRPAVETFVYSPRVEGVHLRAAKVARGGIRWSDRPEDFRAEALGLLKAQMVKNTVIVPQGAKGVFVVKRPPPSTDPEAVAEEVRDCYTMFVRGLLDVTDNRRGDAVVRQPETICHDSDDTYLVLAADKGTAAFSDLANSIAAEYGFWLGDAFASGGSHGYDHKAMAITARGVWTSVRRHFGELGLDPERDEFTAVGIGDMSGDVLGNAMLLSRTIKLVAAFDHRHIFLDPDPDPAVSFTERRRLFDLPRSSWADYDPALISAGGGVFARTAKSIPLTPQVRQVLDVQVDELPADQLIQAILRAPVDLLFNGGVGTYVKACAELNAQVGDRANDGARADAEQLRARVVAEGGNLGFTQRARIEFALRGGRINTDFIDNSAGVDISDREVNLKILLDGVGRLSPQRRDRLLAELGDEVAQQVLVDNYRQALAISVSEALGVTGLDRHLQVMHLLEDDGQLDRTHEALPDDDTVAQRRAAGLGLTRPEIAVLLAYSKNRWTRVLHSTMPDDPYVLAGAVDYLPAALRDAFAGEIPTHPIRREIATTVLANEVINRLGSGLLHRLQQLTGDRNTPFLVYVAARDLLDLPAIWAEIDTLELSRHAQTQVRLLSAIREVIEQASLWLLRNRREIDVATEVRRFRPAMLRLARVLRTRLTGRERQRVERAIAGFVRRGVPEQLCERVFVLDPLCAGMDIAEIAWASGRDLEWTAGLYFALGEKLDLDWLKAQTVEQPGDSHWTLLAKISLRDDLLTQRRRLTAAALRGAETATEPDQLLNTWLDRNLDRVTMYRKTFALLKEANEPDIAMLSVALQELRNLAQSGGGNQTELNGMSS
ncbi:NAD-glutamate dehydrogenase [Saccharopolyspora sp. K220]|uniref:NAD-glutamate dehydrogenase domain-containing protein n=1 Tax=Saccharopolyspora soli TaxID=2926618 RepID=UPI001F58982F|nr:NAD-glutamate dehydrogenase domain-containing protein [Saccharopolyspora soli]MCI2424193.1 NAD-glutamate dehydrogenase [Saccharopolyspora soli]